MYRKQVRRRRAILALLVAASLALLTAYFGESAGGALHGLQRGVLAVLAPIEEGAGRTLKPGRDLIDWAGEVMDAKGENRRLRRERDALRRRLAAAETAARENEELRGLVGLARSEGFPGGYAPLTARVIGRSPTVWYATVTIDKGRSAGIRTDQPVIGPEGLVGRVTALTAGSALITLITDHTSAVSAEVLPSGAGGVVKPAVGDPDDLLLDYIEKGRPVRKGQTVITAGWRSDRLASLFPRGIPIGRVTEASIEERATYQRVHIEPFAELRRMDLVQVLTGGAAGPPGAGTLAAPAARAGSALAGAGGGG